MKNYPNWVVTCKTNLDHTELHKVAFAIKRGALQNLQSISQGKTGYGTFSFEGNAYEMLTDNSVVTELNRLQSGIVAPTHHSDRTYLEFQSLGANQ